MLPRQYPLQRSTTSPATDLSAQQLIRRRWRIFMLSLLVAIPCVGLARLLLYKPSPPEPVYQGRRLSEWLAHKQDGTHVHVGTEEAIRQIGTNAIPTLLQMLRAHDSPLKLKLMDLAQKQHVIPIHWTSAEDHNIAATYAFQILRATASNAVPALIEIYEKRISGQSAWCVVYSLYDIGPAAQSATIPVLAKTLTDSNAPAYVRNTAAVGLSIMYSQPQVAIPALIHGLSDPEPYVRASAAEALMSYGNDAKAAVPALLKLWKDTNTNVWQSTADALIWIAPDAAAKVGLEPLNGMGAHPWNLTEPR